MSNMMTQEEAMNMSNEQAVQILIPMRNMMCDQNGCPISDAVFALDKAIEALSADRPQGWIPCSERLPEEEGWYLVTIQNDKTEKRRTENDLFAIGIAEAHKHTPYKFCKDGHRQTVIAWMPIPKPWKGE